MDDALYIEPVEQDGTQTGWRLVVAIADPTAYIALDSQIEKDAKQRCFTNYLPGFNIPMLPRELSDELCSLMANETRPALVCYIETDLEGNITAKPRFVSAYVQSKAKLAYNKISDYLEQSNRMHGNRKHLKLPNKLIGYINLLKRVFNGVKPIHCYLKRNRITPLFSLKMAK